MKFYWTIITVVFSLVVQAQNYDTVSFQVLNYKKSIIGKLPYTDFELSITNNNRTSLNIPVLFSASAQKNYQFTSNVIAEVEFLDKLDLDTIGPIRLNCCYFGANKKPPSTKLVSDCSITFSTGIGCYLFNIKGNYRVKFRLDPEKCGVFGETHWFEFVID